MVVVGRRLLQLEMKILQNIITSIKSTWYKYSAQNSEKVLNNSPPDSDPIDGVCFRTSSEAFEVGVETLGSPLYWGVHGEKGRVGVVEDGGGVAFPPLDCLDRELRRPLDGMTLLLLEVVEGVAVAAPADVVDEGGGVALFHIWASEATRLLLAAGAANGE